MRQKTLAVLSLITATALLTGCGGDMVLLTSAGEVAREQSKLMMTAIYIMLFVVVPVMIASIWFGWKFHKGNTGADYRPDWSHSTLIEIIVWGIPVCIIAYLGYISYHGTHDLDPYRSTAKPGQKELTIQVIAEQFKWIFIYPEQGIATINEVRFPEKQPIAFKITSNYTMASFFIPKLAGQIYAMTGMQTQDHMIADGIGSYRGFSANYTGYGHTQMRFTACSVQNTEFDKWVSDIKAGQGAQYKPCKVKDEDTYQLAKTDYVAPEFAIQKGLLDQTELDKIRDGNRSKHQIEALEHLVANDQATEFDKKTLALAKAEGTYPTHPNPVTYYSSVEPNLFATIVTRWGSNPHGMHHNPTNSVAPKSSDMATHDTGMVHHDMAHTMNAQENQSAVDSALAVPATPAPHEGEH